MRFYYIIFALGFVVCGRVVHADTCPAGKTEILTPVVPGYGLDIDGSCDVLCPVDGMKELHTSTGAVSHIFAARHTRPALVLDKDGRECYVDLAPNMAVGFDAGVNVTYSGGDFHTLAAAPCREKYTLSYSCGEGSGTPPESVKLRYGDLYSTPFQGNGNTCRRDGYRMDGWIVSGEIKAMGASDNVFGFRADMVATAHWVPGGFSIMYDCKNGKTVSGTYHYDIGGTMVVAENNCGDNAVYRIWNCLEDTGKTVRAGESFPYNYDCSLIMVADTE